MLESADTRADINRPSGRFGFARVSALSVSKLRHTALASPKTLVTPETPTGWGSRYHFAAAHFPTAIHSPNNQSHRRRLARPKASVTVVKPPNPRSYNCRQGQAQVPFRSAPREAEHENRAARGSRKLGGQHVDGTKMLRAIIEQRSAARGRVQLPSVSCPSPQTTAMGTSTSPPRDKSNRLSPDEVPHIILKKSRDFGILPITLSIQAKEATTQRRGQVTSSSKLVAFARVAVGA